MNHKSNFAIANTIRPAKLGAWLTSICITASIGFAIAPLTASAQTETTVEEVELTSTDLLPELNTMDPEAIRILLSPALDTTLVAQMMARIESLNVSLGSAIEEGDTLVQFDCIEAQARLDMAQAEYDGARQNLAVKNNLRKLDAAGDAEVAIASAEARRTKAAVNLSEAQLSLCEVKAPFSGRVAKIYVKPFQGVNSGDPLLEIVSDGPLKIRLNVPSTMLKNLQTGTAFNVHIHETDKTYPATVTAINSRIDAVARTIELEGELNHSYIELLPGMSGIAQFAGTVSN